MAFDGVTCACLAREFASALQDARVYKIAQTEKDELLLTFRTAQETPRGRQIRLLLSAQAGLPLAMFTDETKTAPMQAPAFCMALRKHLENGRVQSVTQPGLERAIRFAISHYDEMGDLKILTLLIELMGKHSNIILIDENDVVLDAIKHVPSSVSSVREVLPGRPYFLPDTRHKRDPLSVSDVVTFTDVLSQGEKQNDACGALVERFTGLSPVMAREICFRAGADATKPAQAFSYEERKALFDAFSEVMDVVRAGAFTPRMYYEKNKAVEYAALPLTMYEADGARFRSETAPDMSAALSTFYARKNAQSRIRNKSADLRHVVQTAIARAARKYDQQLAQIKDAEKRDVYQLRGELLTAYAHEIPAGAKEARLTNYHTGEEIVVSLDPTKTANENAQKCFARYARMKRTYETLSELIKETQAELEHLKSVQIALELSTAEADLTEIRRELVDGGYVRDRGKQKPNKGARREEKSEPLHYVTSDGFDVFVGKNNYQNDRLTFHAKGQGDFWFHAKGVPGSHVVLKADGKELPDRAYEEAAALAAYYSAAKDAGKVEVDYTERTNVKKPGGAKPGFVVYYTNYSMTVAPEIGALKLQE